MIVRPKEFINFAMEIKTKHHMSSWTIEGLLENIGLRKAPIYGVAFSGGGARGFSHAGVMMALEKFGIKPAVLSGVSSGSIAAVLYGSGLTPKEIMDCFNQYTKFTEFTEWAIPKEGFMRLNRFGKILDSWLTVKNLEDLTIPTIVCATDIENAKSIGWSKGEIVERVLASCSIPIVFTPIKIDGINYVDGGVLRNLPAWAIRKYCTVLIGSNCNPVNHRFKYKNSIIDVALRSYQLMQKSNASADLNLCDIVIQSDVLSEYKTFDVAHMKRILVHGYDASCRAIEAYLSNQ